MTRWTPRIRAALAKRHGALLALLLISMATSACAPQLRPQGPEIQPAHMTDSAVFTPDGAELPLRQWVPAIDTPLAVMLALHGFNDYSRAFEDPAPHLAAAGIAVYAYDQRGFGATASAGYWPGVATLVDDMRTVAGLLRDRHEGVPLILLGESMGGAVLLAAASNSVLPGERIVLVAPAVRGRETMNPIYRAALWLSAHVMPWAEVTGRGLGIKASDNRDAIIKLRDDPLVIKRTRVDSIWGLVNLMDAALAGARAIRQPALCLYGANDMLIPSESTQLLYERLGTACRWGTYDSGWHMLLRDHAAGIVLQDIAAWAQDPVATLPSGAEVRARRFFSEAKQDLGE